MSAQDVLRVDGLSVSYRRRGTYLPMLRDVSFAIRPGESLGLVGESGCGKTTAAMSVMRFLPRNARVDAGRIELDGVDLLGLDGEALRRRRGTSMAMVYQEAGGALNPSLRVGDQIAEVFRFHHGSDKREARDRARDLLEKVAVADPARLARHYPHQLSGGQQQRVIIAMALAGNPRLLVLDEPTTALDATVEAEVLDLIARLRTEFDTAILFISHNLGVVARMCDRVAILYAGRIVEEGPARAVLTDARHPYTLGLVRCVPRLGASKHARRLQPIAGTLPALGTAMPGCMFAPRCAIARDQCRAVEPALDPVAPARTARCYFSEETPSIPAESSGRALTNGVAESPDRPVLLQVAALSTGYDDIVVSDDLSIEVRQGETLGLVGESGSGKTTFLLSLAGLAGARDGSIALAGDVLSRRVESRSTAVRRELQMVFQNPDRTLNPSHSVAYTLGRAIKLLKGDRSAEALAREVRLPLEQLDGKTRQLSGGQKQRVAIARAFAGTPTLVLCDEPVSGLDVSVQAAVLNLLADLQDNEQVSYVFISHDLAVVRYLADRIGVMYLGDLVEIGSTEEVFAGPHHPYTEALLSAVPTLDLDQPRERIRLTGTLPSMADKPTGCRFHTRCHRKLGRICESEAPPWQRTSDGHRIRCHIDPQHLTDLQGADGAREPIEHDHEEQG